MKNWKLNLKFKICFKIISPVSIKNQYVLILLSFDNCLKESRNRTNELADEINKALLGRCPQPAATARRLCEAIHAGVGPSCRPKRARLGLGLWSSLPNRALESCEPPQTVLLDGQHDFAHCFVESPQAPLRKHSAGFLNVAQNLVLICNGIQIAVHTL